MAQVLLGALAIAPAGLTVERASACLLPVVGSAGHGSGSCSATPGKRKKWLFLQIGGLLFVGCPWTPTIRGPCK